jgi:type VI secretion system secreted protein Hcp
MAADFLLVIEGIKGESSDGKLKDGIEIHSFNWGCANGGSAAVGSGMGAGKVNYTDISFMAPVSKASPELMLHCASGKPIKKAVLHVRKQGGKQEEYYTVTLEDLIVSSYSTSGVGESVSDSFSLNFSKIKFDYKPQKADGSLDTAVTTGWDIKKGEKV